MTTATRAPASSLVDLYARWESAYRSLSRARDDGASEARLLELEADVDWAFQRYERQKRRIELAAAGTKGWWI